MASGRPDFRWAEKIRASAAFCLVGAVAGTGLYFGNLAYVRAGDEAARAAAARQALSAPKLLVTLPAHSGVNGGAFSPDGALLATADGNGTVQLWTF